MSRYKDYLMEKEENLDSEIIKLNTKNFLRIELDAKKLNFIN